MKLTGNTSKTTKALLHAMLNYLTDLLPQEVVIATGLCGLKED